jgi:hypothetical protein
MKKESKLQARSIVTNLHSLIQARKQTEKTNTGFHTEKHKLEAQFKVASSLSKLRARRFAIAGQDQGWGPLEPDSRCEYVLFPP